ncbi:zinc finger protein ZAT5-like [Impatiens glandulifera]|uniref:zinc finger protein ZAT5-like n=1 Tax=Impatiens glandulifera TaxID=253017 RepID=UPI001FB06E97|nr:zinc finger protein ZAT5-like [Impatiens glandulifera]
MEEVLQDQTFIIKGKRSKRSRSLSSPFTLPIVDSSITEEEESSLFQMDHQFSNNLPPSVSEEEQDMANCLILLAQGQTKDQNSINFPCRTCDRSFPSFQALGGHRASHKKPKPTPTLSLSASPEIISPATDNQLTMLENDRTALTLQIPFIVKSKVHECSVCRAEFSSGQALGGHMRRHRPIVPLQLPLPPAAVEKRRNLHYLDLNLPAPEDDCRDFSKFPFGSKGGKVIVFSGGSHMVDCHY